MLFLKELYRNSCLLRNRWISWFFYFCGFFQKHTCTFSCIFIFYILFSSTNFCLVLLYKLDFCFTFIVIHICSLLDTWCRYKVSKWVESSTMIKHSISPVVCCWTWLRWLLDHNGYNALPSRIHTSSGWWPGMIIICSRHNTSQSLLSLQTLHCFKLSWPWIKSNCDWFW